MSCTWTRCRLSWTGWCTSLRANPLPRRLRPEKRLKLLEAAVPSWTVDCPAGARFCIDGAGDTLSATGVRLILASRCRWLLFRLWRQRRLYGKVVQHCPDPRKQPLRLLWALACLLRRLLRPERMRFTAWCDEAIAFCTRSMASLLTLCIIAQYATDPGVSLLPPGRSSNRPLRGDRPDTIRVGCSVRPDEVRMDAVEIVSGNHGQSPPRMPHMREIRLFD